MDFAISADSASVTSSIAKDLQEYLVEDFVSAFNSMSPVPVSTYIPGDVSCFTPAGESISCTELDQLPYQEAADHGNDNFFLQVWVIACAASALLITCATVIVCCCCKRSSSSALEGKGLSIPVPMSRRVAAAVTEWRINMLLSDSTDPSSKLASRELVDLRMGMGNQNSELFVELTNLEMAHRDCQLVFVVASVYRTQRIADALYSWQANHKQYKFLVKVALEPSSQAVFRDVVLEMGWKWIANHNPNVQLADDTDEGSHSSLDDCTDSSECMAWDPESDSDSEQTECIVPDCELPLAPAPASYELRTSFTEFEIAHEDQI